MEFTNSTLAGLMATTPSEPEVVAERANLCMEERVSAARQAAYEDRVGARTDGRTGGTITFATCRRRSAAGIP